MKDHIWAVICMPILLVISMKLLAQPSSKAILTPLQYEELLNEHFNKDGPGATVLVAKKGEVVYQGAIGMANLELNIPMDSKHVFKIASLTKQFTAVAILMLMEEEKLDLQDEVTKFLPEYSTHQQKITIEHLLTHTSGIPNISDLPAWSNNIRNDISPAEMIVYFENEPLEFKPGTRSSYSNSGYFLLGLIIEKVSGMTYADFIQQSIFKTVEMDNAYYGSYHKIIPNRAGGYQIGSNGYENAPYISMNLPFSAGALAMNIHDFYKWHQALNAGKLIKQETLIKAQSPYRLQNGENSENGYGWGLGQFFGSPTIEHSGSLFGFLTTATYLPKEDLFVAIFSNCDCQNPEPVLNKILGIESGNYTLKRPIDLTNRALEEYTGIYQTESQTKVIALKGNQLTYQIDNGLVYNIFPFAKDQFYFKNYLTTLQFKRVSNGAITGFESTGSMGGEISLKTNEMLASKQVIQVDPKILRQFVGKYDMEAGFSIEITLEKNHLFGSSPGQTKMQLHAESETTFFVEEMDAQLEFLRTENGVYDKVKLKMGEREIMGAQQQ